MSNDNPIDYSMTLDELAECYEGIGYGTPLYVKLWNLLDGVPEADQRPSGGDGTDGTLECPPAPGDYPAVTVWAHWSEFTDAEKDTIRSAVTAEANRYV